jgi:hypothetical protein
MLEVHRKSGWAWIVSLSYLFSLSLFSLVDFLQIFPLLKKNKNKKKTYIVTYTHVSFFLFRAMVQWPKTHRSYSRSFSKVLCFELPFQSDTIPNKTKNWHFLTKRNIKINPRPHNKWPEKSLAIKETMCLQM